VADPKRDSKPNPAPADGQAPIPWASRGGEFLVAIQACGCQVKVRDGEAAQRMAATVCRKHGA
jgi:hypothetical protein